MKKLILLGLLGLGAANVQAQNWLLLGNAGTNPANNFLGTTDNQNVVFRRNNVRAGLLTLQYENTSFGVGALSGVNATTGGGFSTYGNSAFGSNALLNNTGSSNTALGTRALLSNSSGYGNVATGSYSLSDNTTGSANTAIGTNALRYNTTGNNNTGIGTSALFLNTTGYENTGTGYLALINNTTGYYNVANGTYSLYSNTTGYRNTAIGGDALYNNNVGIQNTAVGIDALFSNTLGGSNTAIGVNALYYSTTGFDNVAVGDGALRNNTTANGNTAVGHYALEYNTTGTNNAAFGEYALWTSSTGSGNTAVGQEALLYINVNPGTGVPDAYNTSIGAYSGPLSAGFQYSTAVGAFARPTASNQVWLGGNTVNSVRAGASYTIISDGRFKKNIQENVPGLEFINQLKPVTYNYKIKELNSFTGEDKGSNQRKEAEASLEAAVTAKEKIVYTGFVAQEVEKAAEKVGYNFSGVYKPQNDKDPYGLSYSDFVVPLVKAVQELSAKNEEKQNEIKQLSDKLKSLEDKLNTLLNSHSGTTQVNNSNSIVLDQNAPNPFAESTVISYSINEDFGNALISISDNNGVVIKTYAITTKGKAQLTVYGNNLSAGIYHYTLIVDGKTLETKTMVKN